MIKFTGDGKDGRCFFLGLSRGNIDLLVSGKPIKVNLRDIGGPPITIGILFGETERLLFNDLKKQGLLPPELEFIEATPDKDEVVILGPRRKPEKSDPWPDCEGK